MSSTADILSIIIPTRNRRCFLSQTLKSIFSGLAVPIEIVIIDGNSNDGTSEFCQDLFNENARIVYHKEVSNRGFDFDLNTGISLATGKYCWMFSDDDLIDGEAVGRIVRLLNESSDLDLVLINAQILDKELKYEIQDRFVQIYKDTQSKDIGLLFNNYIDYLTFFGCVILKRDKWNFKLAERFYGTCFIHVCQIFANHLINWLFISEPLIKLRYGNASWTSRSFEIWLKNWPTLLYEIESVPKELIIKKFPLKFSSLFKKLFFYKANKLEIGDMSLIKSNLTRTELYFLKYSINLLPQVVCRNICLLYARALEKKILLYDLTRK